MSPYTGVTYLDVLLLLNLSSVIVYYLVNSPVLQRDLIFLHFCPNFLFSEGGFVYIP